MVERGFAAGQGGGTTVVYCASLTDFAQRWPSVFAQVGPIDGHPNDGLCIDVTVEGSVADGVTRADIEYVLLSQIRADGAPGEIGSSGRVGLDAQLDRLRSWVEAVLPVPAPA